MVGVLVRGLKEQVVAQFRLLRPRLLIRVGFVPLSVRPSQLEEEGGVGGEEKELGQHG